MFLSKSISSPSVSIDSVPVPLRTGGFEPERTGNRVGGGKECHFAIALPSMTSISRRTLAISAFKPGGRTPDGHGFQLRWFNIFGLVPTLKQPPLINKHPIDIKE